MRVLRYGATVYYLGPKDRLYRIGRIRHPGGALTPRKVTTIRPVTSSDRGGD
jgi:hypothetical protein